MHEGIDINVGSIFEFLEQLYHDLEHTFVKLKDDFTKQEGELNAMNAQNKELGKYGILTC